MAKVSWSASENMGRGIKQKIFSKQKCISWIPVECTDTLLHVVFSIEDCLSVIMCELMCDTTNSLTASRDDSEQHGQSNSLIRVLAGSMKTGSII